MATVRLYYSIKFRLQEKTGGEGIVMAQAPDSLLRSEGSVLLIVDIQERFRPSIGGMAGLIGRAQILARAAVRLGIPVLATEQYPKALGPTVPELRQWLPATQEYIPKMCFSSFACEPLRQALAAVGRKQVLLAGIEAHVCVLQTGLELLAAGYQVYVATDAVSSRQAADREAGLQRLERHGAEQVTTEMVIFEWLRTAGTPEFKELQALIK
jgi:nicotinamidase-related amidase